MKGKVRFICVCGKEVERIGDVCSEKCKVIKRRKERRSKKWLMWWKKDYFMMKFAKNCICGARMTATVSNKIGKFLLQEWEKTHSGKGHKSCDARTASRARNRNDNPEFYR